MGMIVGEEREMVGGAHMHLVRAHRWVSHQCPLLQGLSPERDRCGEGGQGESGKSGREEGRKERQIHHKLATPCCLNLLY